MATLAPSAAARRLAPRFGLDPERLERRRDHTAARREVVPRVVLERFFGA